MNNMKKLKIQIFWKLSNYQINFSFFSFFFFVFLNVLKKKKKIFFLRGLNFIFHKIYFFAFSII